MEKFENLLMCVAVDQVTSDRLNTEFDRASFRPVKSFIGDRAVFGSDAKITRLYNLGKAPQVDDLIEGKIITLKTTPRSFVGRDGSQQTANTINVAVFGDESPVEVANAQLKRERASVLDANGKPTVQFEPTLVNTTETTADPKQEPAKAGE